jgi:hypothetical protein
MFDKEKLKEKREKDIADSLDMWQNLIDSKDDSKKESEKKKEDKK